MMNLRVAICDDEEIMRSVVKETLIEYSIKRNLEVDIKEYACGEDLIDSPHKHDMIIMDYKLDPWGKTTGISVAKKLRNSNIDSGIIFLSSYPNVVFRSFEVSTFRFLVKPLERDLLFKALDDYQKSISIDKTLIIRLERMNINLNTKRIAFLEGNGKYCLIHSLDHPAKLECHETLAAVEERLPEDSFYRCHRSYLVNMRYVNTFNNQEIALKNDEIIPISRNKYKPFQEAFLDYTRQYGF